MEEKETPTILREPKHLDSIDLVESLAMFFVITYHANLCYTDFLSVPSTARYLTYVLRGGLSVCVPLFFLANGYLLFREDFDWKKHLRRTLRMLALTLCWAAITLVILIPIKGEELSLREFFRAISNWKYGWIHHLWFMGALICIYVFFPLLKTAYDHSLPSFWVFLIVCLLLTFGNSAINGGLTVLERFFGKLPPPNGPGGNMWEHFRPEIIPEELIEGNRFNIFNPFRGWYGWTMAYFCLGGAARALGPKLCRIASIRGHLLGTLALIISFAGLGLWGIYISKFSHHVWDPVFNGYDTVFTLIAASVTFLMLLCCRELPRRLSSILRLIASNTLGIYFIHWIIVQAVLPKLWEYPRFGNLPCNLLLGAALTVLCAVLSELLGRAPLLRLLTGRPARRRSSEGASDASGES